MYMKGTPSACTGRRCEKHLFIFFLHLSSTQSTFQKVGQYCPTYNSGRYLLKMPQQGSIFSNISPGSPLGKSMTGKLVYNFPLMSMNYTSSLLPVPNSNDNYTVTLTRITAGTRALFYLSDMERQNYRNHRTSVCIDYADQSRILRRNKRGNKIQVQTR